MDDEFYYLMGTGSRSMVNHPHAVEIYNGLKNFILEMYRVRPNLVLISGLAEGWDEAIAKVGMREKIPYIVAIPHPTYGQYYWRDHSVTGRNRMNMFTLLVQSAKEVVTVSDSIFVNGTHSNFIRNTWMVNHCNEATVYMAHSSGTRDAVAKLKSVNKPMTFFDDRGRYQPSLPL